MQSESEEGRSKRMRPVSAKLMQQLADVPDPEVEKIVPSSEFHKPKKAKKPVPRLDGAEYEDDAMAAGAPPAPEDASASEDIAPRERTPSPEPLSAADEFWSWYMPSMAPQKAKPAARAAPSAKPPPVKPPLAKPPPADRAPPNPNPPAPRQSSETVQAAARADAATGATAACATSACVCTTSPDGTSAGKSLVPRPRPGPKSLGPPVAHKEIGYLGEWLAEQYPNQFDPSSLDGWTVTIKTRPGPKPTHDKFYHPPEGPSLRSRLEVCRLLGLATGGPVGRPKVSQKSKPTPRPKSERGAGSSGWAVVSDDEEPLDPESALQWAQCDLCDQWLVLPPDVEKPSEGVDWFCDDCSEIVKVSGAS